MYCQIILGFCVYISAVHAYNDVELKAWFIQQGITCSKDHSISPDEIMMLQKLKIPETHNVKCLLDCIFKKTAYVDSAGKFDVKKANEWADKEYTGSATQLKNMKEINEICNKVYEEPIPEGGSDCDKSYKIMKCLLEGTVKDGIS